ncbi:hypothetical protein [Paenibacillus xylaniclasticus]|uniref:hypothetical protein n=1 Tax=Paenibacillus xylaniclasticus TaxID=588083 RepID=UPI000FD8B5A0|nr:hypothetical protein [Paenibacillus xylaniclasticus]
MNKEMDEITQRAKHYSERIFGEHLLFSAFTGSIIYSGAIKGRSDIDWYIVVKDSYSLLNQQDRAQREEAFKEAYYELNNQFMYIPDINWPGEIILEKDLMKSLSFQDFTKIYSDEELSNPDGTTEDLSYYIWFFYIAYSQFVAGCSQVYMYYRSIAWMKIVYHSITDSQVPYFNIDDVINFSKKFGYRDRYIEFINQESVFLSFVRNQLFKAGYVNKKDDLYIVNEEKIHFLKDLKNIVSILNH